MCGTLVISQIVGRVNELRLQYSDVSRVIKGKVQIKDE